ncbi:hypothetical protein ACTFQF_00740 [Aliivibrio fischeri]|uniref:hypothetical protein n=1 Tax=Aliivibrio fischeri TaxID=668 RepID=UPI0007C50A5F|nr:hypothetical protein [Aliivibrio fischeri]
MNVILYFCGLIAAGVFTSTTCALINWVGGKDYPNNDNDNDNDNGKDKKDSDIITKKRLGWLFIWVMQGVIAGFIVSNIFAEYVLRDGGEVGYVWAISFIAGSVSWFNFNESVKSLTSILKIPFK